MNDVNTYLWAVLNAGVLALIYAVWKTNWINKQDEGTERMVLIGKSIAEGALAFLKADAMSAPPAPQPLLALLAQIQLGHLWWRSTLGLMPATDPFGQDHRLLKDSLRPNPGAGGFCENL